MGAHPGKTPAQRRVLDEIGCGNHSPIMANATRDKLLRDGLIVELASEQVPAFGSLCMTVRRFDMPIHVHIQWCEAMAAAHPGDPDLATGCADDAQEKAR